MSFSMSKLAVVVAAMSFVGCVNSYGPDLAPNTHKSTGGAQALSDANDDADNCGADLDGALDDLDDGAGEAQDNIDDANAALDDALGRGFLERPAGVEE